MAHTKRVFFSYAHISEDHKNRVLQLCNQFRESGLDSWLDQYEPSPPQGWPQLMVQEIKKADFVLIVCSEIYRRRFEGDEPKGTGRGAKWEGAIITHGLYEAEGDNRKFVPIVMDANDMAFIPTVLSPFTHFDASKQPDRESLYRLLTDQPMVVPPPIGGVDHMAPTPIEPGDPLTQRRVRAKIKFTSSSGGWLPLLKIANVSNLPLYLENPQLILTRAVTTAEELPSDLYSQSIECAFLPTKPASGPLLPTQQRTYFLPPEALRFIQNDKNLFGNSSPSVRIATAVSEELVIDDDKSVRFLKTLLGFPELSDPNQYEIRMPLIMGLVHKRCTDQADAPYKVYAPREVVDDPTIVERDDVVDRLKDKHFQVVFADGVSERLSLAELMSFTQQLIFLSVQLQEIHEQLERSEIRSAEIDVKMNFFPHLAMHPEVVKLLFTKIHLEPVPFDTNK